MRWARSPAGGFPQAGGRRPDARGGFGNGDNAIPGQAAPAGFGGPVAQVAAQGGDRAGLAAAGAVEAEAGAGAARRVDRKELLRYGARSA